MKTQSTDSSTSLRQRVERVGRISLVRFIVLLLVALACAKLLGRLTVHYVNDSASYLDYPFDSLSDALVSIRTPGYPLFLKCVEWTCGIAFLPLVQIIIHATAAWLLGNELFKRTDRVFVAGAASLAVVLGCTFTDHVHTVSTDVIGLSAAVFCLTYLLRSSRIGGVSNLICTALFATIAIFLRPAYLFLIPWVLIVGWLIVGIDNPTSELRRRFSCVLVSVSVALIVVTWMFVRSFVVIDFAVLPFGHQNLSGITVQLVSPDEMRRLFEDDDQSRQSRLADGVARQLGSGVYETREGRGLATLTIESQWDEINYRVVWPTARQIVQDLPASDSSLSPVVQEHQLIGDLNFAILRAYPKRYLRWILLAARRAVWGTVANICMHPVFLLALGSIVALWMIRLLKMPTKLVFECSRGWNAFCFAGITFWVFKAGFVALSSPPIGRFADAGAVFLPAILFGSLLLAKRERLPEKSTTLL